MAEVIQADKVINAEEGNLRVWWVRNPPSPCEYHIVSSPSGAINVLQKLTTADAALSRRDYERRRYGRLHQADARR